MRIPRIAVIAAVTLPLVVGTAAVANAAKPQPVTCEAGTTAITVDFDRQGQPSNVDPHIIVVGDNVSGTITAPQDVAAPVLITGFVRHAGRVSDTVSLFGQQVTDTPYDNVGLDSKRGKPLTLTSIDVCTVLNVDPTPTPTSTPFELNASSTTCGTIDVMATGASNEGGLLTFTITLDDVQVAQSAKGTAESFSVTLTGVTPGDHTVSGSLDESGYGAKTYPNVPVTVAAC